MIERRVMGESLIEEPLMIPRERIEADREIHHRDLGFIKVDKDKIGNNNYFSRKNHPEEVLVDLSGIKKSKVTDSTVVKNVGQASSNGVRDPIDAEFLEANLATQIEDLAADDCKNSSISIDGSNNHRVSEVQYAMLKGIPHALGTAISTPGATIQTIRTALEAATVYEYHPEGEYAPLDHSNYDNWKEGNKTFKKAGFSFPFTVKKEAGSFWCQIRMKAPETGNRSLCVGRSYKNISYSNKLNDLVIAEIQIDQETAKQLMRPEGIQHIIAKGNPKSFMGHKGINSSELEAHLLTPKDKDLHEVRLKKVQLHKAGEWIKSVVKRIWKEFKEDMVGSGYNFLKLRGLPLRKKFDMILVGFGKFIPDYLAFFRIEIPPKSGGAVTIMLIFVVPIGFIFAVSSFGFRLVKPIFAFLVYGYFTMLGHPTLTAVPHSVPEDKVWLRFTFFIKWAFICIFAAPVGVTMFTYKLVGCKLYTREVARAAGMNTEGVYTGNGMELSTVNKYKDYPKLSRFLNLYTIIPTIGVGVSAIVLMLVLSLFLNPIALAIALAIIVGTLLPILGTAWYTEIYRKQSKDNNILFTVVTGKIVLNSKNRFGAYILAEMEQILYKKNLAKVTHEEVFKAFLDVVSLNKNPEFIGALNEFLDFYELLFYELSMGNLEFAKKYLGDTITNDNYQEVLKGMTQLMEGLRICVLRPKDEVLGYEYNSEETVLKDLEDDSIIFMKNMLATAYSDFEYEPPNLNFSLYASSNITSSGKFEYYNDIASTKDVASPKPDPEYLALRRKFDEVACYPERFSDFGIKNYHYRHKVRSV